MAKNYFICEVCSPVVPGKHQRLIRSHLEAIRERRRMLAEGQRLLEAKTRLRPADCDSLAAMLRALLQAVKDFKELLKDGNHLPQSVAPKRYKLFVSLNYAEKHIMEILPLLSSFRKICLGSSRGTYKMLEQLRDRFTALLRVSETLEPETNELLAKAVAENLIILPVWTRDVEYNN